MGRCKVIIANSKQSFAFAQGLNSLTYNIPESLATRLQPGSLVMVPLRKGKENALVIETSSETENLGFELRDVDELVIEQLYPTDLLELIKYTADYYACSYSEVVSAILPGALVAKPIKEVEINKEARVSEDLQEIWSLLCKARGGRMRYSRLKTLCGLSELDLKKTLTKLSAQGAVVLRQQLRKSRYKSIPNPLAELGLHEECGAAPELTAAQEEALTRVRESESESVPKFVLHGVTGSGKTEIYLRLIEDAIAAGKSVIALVPEISLAPQLIGRISSRIHEDSIVVWHSALSKSERQYTWDKILEAQQNGKPLVVVGARSAIFAPVTNLGLIVVDEEHENTYKQESPAPRYHAVHLAAKRAEFTQDCRVIYGSATPSVEIYHKALSDSHPDYHLLELPDRVFAATLPQVEIVDMREELAANNRGVFSRKLKEAVNQALEANEQTILFLNRRGSASHVFCRTCGYTYHCPNCSAKVVYHSDSRLMVCHHCGHQEAHPTECSSCNLPTVKFFGLGTQKLEEETRKTFPNARVGRLDGDVRDYLDVLRRFKNREIDILIGTQMIAKGLDLPQLTTVGVVAADTHFMQLDYQAEERAFQLLTQVAGRAGRRDKQGRVIFQTYNPERATLVDASKQDYKDFYSKEIDDRSMMAYPPFTNIVRIVSTADDDTEALAVLNDFHETIAESFTVLGPSPCLLSKLKNKYRYHLLVKTNKSSKTDIKTAFNEYKQQNKNAEISLLIDVDSSSMH